LRCHDLPFRGRIIAQNGNPRSSPLPFPRDTNHLTRHPAQLPGESCPVLCQPFCGEQTPETANPARSGAAYRRGREILGCFAVPTFPELSPLVKRKYPFSLTRAFVPIFRPVSGAVAVSNPDGEPCPECEIASNPDPAQLSPNLLI
jgi:hypothetical protein